MKLQIIVFSLITLALTSTLSAQNNVCFTIEVNPNSSDPALSVFTKYVNVYGCGIYAEAGVVDSKVLHAAAVWAELIDNDEDGIADDPALLAELQNNNALMPIFESDGNAAMNTFFNNYSGSGVAAVLWQTEMDPSQTGHWGDDATVEEILHTINSVGHASIYSSAFSFSPNSSLLSAAMDTARGGQFTTIPTPYPASAWYHYDDNTCDYGCMAIEYVYWMIVTNMGILDDPTTCSGIANEWEPCSQSLLQSTDVLGYALITDPQYKLPQNAPDGNYCPAQSGISEMELFNKGLVLSPNPSEGIFKVTFTSQQQNVKIVVFNPQGQTVFKQENQNINNVVVTLSDSPSGMYFVEIATELGIDTLKYIKH